MSHQVQIDYQGIAIQCNSICEVAEKRLQELDEMLTETESTSTRLLNEQVKRLAKEIRSERDKLQAQIKAVRQRADKKAERGVVSVDNEREEYRQSRDDIAAAEKLQRTVDELASERLIEFQSLLQTLLAESIDENQRKLRDQIGGVVTVDARTQALLDGIADEVLRQFTYLAYLGDNTLSGDRLLQAGQVLMEQTVNQTYEQRYEQERAKIRAELEAARVSSNAVDKVLESSKGTLQERLIEVRQAATAEIVGEKVRQKSLKIIMDAIKQRGFVVDRKNIKIKRDTNEVILVALKASGEKAEFRIFLDGKFIYDFHGYEGQACQKDIEPFMHDLEEIYGIKVTKQTELWSNPYKISTMKYQAINTNKNKK